MLPNILQFTIASFLTYFLIALFLPTLKRRLLDKPNQRSSHLSPTPRGGGIAFVIVGSLLTVFFSSGTYRWVPIVCLPLAAVGFLDDHQSLPATWRYTVQLITAYFLLVLANIQLSLWQFALCIVLITAIINFMNFMDGLDGIMAGCSVLLFAATAQWSISGAIFGFLLWNWSPAKIFMGDVGSTFIGAVFVGSAFQQQTGQEACGLLLLAFPLFADAVTCILRRLISKQNIFSAHRQHLYQRLHQAGWNHAKVATLYIFAVLLLVIGYHFGHMKLLVILIFIEFFIGVFLDRSVAIKFKMS